MILGNDVDGFSRGKQSIENNLIRGDIYQMSSNPFLGNYDYVINFIIIKNGGIDANLKYCKSLIDFCKSHAKHLIQISSISVYPNDANYINEKSPIETDPSMKGGYASIKVVVDNFLLKHSEYVPITFVRPGYVISKDRKPSLNGIIKPLFNFGVLYGDSKTSLPLIEREKLHDALSSIITQDEPLSIYLICENTGGTKKHFAERFFCKNILTLPRSLILLLSKTARKMGILSTHYESLIKGLFKRTYFDSSESEYNLKQSFTNGSICVIGAGAYGSYTINTLITKGINPRRITLIDVGDNSVKSEEEIGFGSQITNAPYTGTKKGRFFGSGGASAKWGGQLLMFTENDFSHPSRFMSDIISLNKKYKDIVFKKFGINNPMNDKIITPGLFARIGIWLGYFNRNLFRYFHINKLHIFQRRNLRVLDFEINDQGIITGITLLSQDGKKIKAYYDQYFLCAGAFECNRILMQSLGVKSQRFSDHLSQKIFEVNGSTKIGNEDFAFRVKGTSLVTKRMIGEIDDVSFFANPIYNSEFPFFQNIKAFLFKGKLNISLLLNVIKDMPSAIKFVWNMAINRKVFVYNNRWHFYIDIENPSESLLNLSNEVDAWGVPYIEVKFSIDTQASMIYKEASEILRKYLSMYNVNFTDCQSEIKAEKSEDTYHPYGMMLSDSEDIESYFSRFPNMLVVNTGILPRAGGINTTAACFPIIEEYVTTKIC